MPRPRELAHLPHGYQLELVKKEDERELRHRLLETAKDSNQRRRQAQVTLWLIAVTYVALLLLSFYLAIWGESEQQKWALGALTAILGSMLGYLVGQKT